MKSLKKISKFSLPLVLSFPFLLSGCETVTTLFDDSGSSHRSYPSNHRPVDIYENDRQAVSSENSSANRSYSITNQQGRTHRQTTADEATDSGSEEVKVPVTPPSVPGDAPKLAE